MSTKSKQEKQSPSMTNVFQSKRTKSVISCMQQINTAHHISGPHMGKTKFNIKSDE